MVLSFWFPSHHLFSGEAVQVGSLNVAWSTHVHALATRPDLLQQLCFVCCTVYVAGRSNVRLVQQLFFVCCTGHVAGRSK
jgi:hypothetical protein